MNPLGLALGLLVAGLLIALVRVVVLLRGETAPPAAQDAGERCEELGRLTSRERCPRCNGPAVALSGTGRGWRCEGCGLGFVGLEHARRHGARRSAQG